MNVANEWTICQKYFSVFFSFEFSSTSGLPEKRFEEIVKINQCFIEIFAMVALQETEFQATFVWNNFFDSMLPQSRKTNSKSQNVFNLQQIG